MLCIVLGKDFLSRLPLAFSSCITLSAFVTTQLSLQLQLPPRLCLNLHTNIHLSTQFSTASVLFISPSLNDTRSALLQAPLLSLFLLPTALILVTALC